MLNSTVQYCSQQGIYLTRSSPLIQGCTIQQNSSYGLYCYDTSSPQVLGNQVVSNSSYGIYLYGTAVSNHNCLPVIQGNALSGNGTYALYAYNYYQANQLVVDARSNWWGTADALVIADLQDRSINISSEIGGISDVIHSNCLPVASRFQQKSYIRTFSRWKITRGFSVMPTHLFQPM